MLNFSKSITKSLRIPKFLSLSYDCDLLIIVQLHNLLCTGIPNILHSSILCNLTKNKIFQIFSYVYIY